MQLPGGLSADLFLKEYWQKKPLIIRQAFPGYRSPVSADELAGLACEPAVESRLVLEQENGKPWQLHNGPFEPERFSELPETHWTLLVQGLDHWVPAVADLLDSFRFVPNWRLDDIMASYAPVGGSVGPHYDQYDVFLLQAEGHRRWHFGGHCDETSARIEGTPLRILRDWQGETIATLAPGDMLYLPPGIGHHGIAEDDCLTFSIGFRAPSVDDLMTGFTDFLSTRPQAGLPVSDPDLSVQTDPGLIGSDVISRLKSVIEAQLTDERQLALWFGQYSTAPKNLDTLSPPTAPIAPEALVEAVNEGIGLRWNEGSRFAHVDWPDQTALFVDGERYLLNGDAGALAPVLCRSNRIESTAIAKFVEDNALAGLITALYNQGSLYLDEPDDDYEET
ncbi:MAG: cupin domain-containing protein [Marinobacter sp.]|nr:cupin domain-containing protein [Marinobacter sp.]